VISAATANAVAIVDDFRRSSAYRQGGIARSFSKSIRLVFFASAIWLAASFTSVKIAAASASEAAICDTAADHFLSIENYPETIRLHREVLKRQPTNSLVYYHLGFSYGMLDDQANEIRAYRQAIALGLVRWDLFLNLGLAYLHSHDLEGATHSLQLAALLGPSHHESHFNLALVYERRGMLHLAEREMLESLWLDPMQPDASNMLAVIYAEQGDEAGASAEWRDLLRAWPGYLPARTNLAILDATHTSDAPPREQQVEKATIRDARPLYYSSVTGIGD
jgi:Flp pilus assembly protein TadD